MPVYPDPDRTPVAADVFTWCTKEKAETWHVVVCHGSGGIVERVRCKACGSDHRYKKKEKSGPVMNRASTVIRRTTSASAAPKAPSPSLEENWFAGVKKWGEKPVPNFSPDAHFAIGDVFTHEVFGKGVVQTRRASKVDVLFRDGSIRTLPSKG